jgi:2,3,4,5-tetrahydropyridine-2-carboxylate N-succinyltransferase
LGANTTITASIRIVDVTGPEPVDHRGVVPPNAVVVPGSRPRQFLAGTYHLQTPLIIGWRDESTDRKTTLNDALRVFEVQV